MSSSLWTIEFRGGTSFTIQVPGNPVISHHGGVSVFHIMGTERTIQAVQRYAEQHGCRTLVHRETQTREQARVRELALEPKTLLSKKCVACFWYDPTLVDAKFCGAYGWDMSFKVACCMSRDDAAQDLLDCPVPLSDFEEA